MDAQLLQQLQRLTGGRGGLALPADDTTPLLAVVTGWYRGPHLQAKLIGKIRKCLDAHPAMDLDARGALGKTALCCLVEARHNAAARFLIERGADPLLADNEGHSALTLAMAGAGGQEGVGTSFFLVWALRAARQRSPEAAAAVQRMLDRHILPEGAPNADSSPSMLEMAIVTKACSDALVGMLLDCGASVDGGDGARRTPLQLAANKRRAGVISMLLERGATVDTASPIDGATALLIAVIHEDADSMALLLRAGADPKARMAADVGAQGNPAWAGKDACDLAHMNANSVLAETLRTWTPMAASPTVVPA
ncbi:Ankyrin repeat domain containing protein [Pandoravirus neocaledonia]|uniref:Ankyrin repeat domain containing protein n=1 Tax=Pandoravirus neocaledonia TaxID=2107708 RepID=A0A2U7UBQ7_9VIRU|nr:Ankyrin repeat domain containing protein [Pandoravirus neocaledonia]AVK75887.1 Ankyrin repeat domain containing protein [Pandoravirus neocaledonia]